MPEPGPSVPSLPAHLAPLAEPGFWPDAPAEEPPQVLETHISWVFLAGSFAWKVKKPVDFGFLDFSTLERRAHFCRRELELNRRLASELYLDILPLNMTTDGLRPAADGPVVEWCLKMRRFDQQDLLDARLQAARFDPGWLDTLAARIGAFHARQPPVPAPETNAAAILAAHVRANLDTAHKAREKLKFPLANLCEQTNAELARQLPRLQARQEQGRVRDGHGDLHLRNITLVQGRPVPFDCIEFDDDLRRIDVMNDAAFLVMDLFARERPDLAMRFLSRWLEATGDYDGLHPLRLFLAYRAGVRGKVACLLAQGQAGREADAAWNEARRYFALSRALLARPASLRLFVVGGFSGAGKSHLALLGAGIERAIVIRSDATRKRIARDRPDLPRYGEAMNERTRKALFEAADTALAAGWPVILDATFLSPTWREEARALGARHGADTRLFWIDVPEATLRARVKARTEAGRDISDADLAVLEQQIATCQRPDEPDIRFLPDSDQGPGTSCQRPSPA
ncbi:MAG: AAA family ATPase [Mariprofundaceae bacterium]